MDQVFDLFGDPVPENWGGRGRPAHIATNEFRRKVSMLLAFGWGNDRIARAIGVTKPTLRKHYFSQLKVRDEMRDRLDASLAMQLWRQVEAGNVSAMREFRALLEQNDLMVYGGARAEDAPAPVAPRLGKKEQADVDARTPDTSTEMGRLMASRALN